MTGFTVGKQKAIVIKLIQKHATHAMHLEIVGLVQNGPDFLFRGQINVNRIGIP